jgi:hypothetical protein
MYAKKSLSLLVIFIFTFVISLGIIGNKVKAQLRTGDQTSEETEDSQSDDELIRNEAFYNYGETTNAAGGVTNWWEYGPDIGVGETGYGYTQTDPWTGTTVTYSTTGIGTGVGGPLAGYGGMYSPLASESYGIFAGGATPQYNVNPKYGYNTQLSTSGSLLGPSSTYTASTPDPLMQLGMTLSQQSQTQGLGLALATLSGLQYSQPFGSSYLGGYGTSLGGYGYSTPYAGYGTSLGGYGYSTPYAGYGTSLGGYGYSTPYAGYGTSLGGYGYGYGTGYSGYGYPSTSGYYTGYTGGAGYYPTSSSYGYY